MTCNGHLTTISRIQQAEKECSQQVFTAQADAEERKRLARREVAKLKEEARALGHQQGERDYQSALASARREAQHIVQQAREHAKQLVYDNETYINKMIDTAMAIIRGDETS